MDTLDQIRNEMREVYLNDYRDWVVACSFGKDSSLVLTLVWQMLESLPLEKRTKKVYVITSDTLVETPAMSNFVRSAINRVQDRANQLHLPIDTRLVEPKMERRFFYKTLGRGDTVPTPESPFRWCTPSLKIETTQEVIQNILSITDVTFNESEYEGIKQIKKAIQEQDGKQAQFDVILLTGSRDEESARRKASLEKHALTDGTKWARHSDFSNILMWHPIKYVLGDELWFYFMELGQLPFGVDVQELEIQYGKNFLECGMKMDSKESTGQSCGASGSRSGCWTCGMCKPDDPMLLQLIGEGKKDYRHLLEWKKLLVSMRNDIRYREALNRREFTKSVKSFKTKSLYQGDLFAGTDEQHKHHYEAFQRAIFEEYEPGGMTVEARRILLEDLLYRQKATGYELIQEEEIQAILAVWASQDAIVVKREELQPRLFQYDGPLVYHENGKMNKNKTKTPYPTFHITVELNMEEDELYEFMKERQRVNQGKGIYFFSHHDDYYLEKAGSGVVWNKAIFVVCHKDVTDKSKAYQYVYKWLGWLEAPGMNERAKDAALKHLMVSAIGEALRTQQEKKKLHHLLTLMGATTDSSLQVSCQDDGQMSLII